MIIPYPWNTTGKHIWVYCPGKIDESLKRRLQDIDEKVNGWTVELKQVKKKELVDECGGGKISYLQIQQNTTGSHWVPAVITVDHLLDNQQDDTPHPDQFRLHIRNKKIRNITLEDKFCRLLPRTDLAVLTIGQESHHVLEFLAKSEEKSNEGFEETVHIRKIHQFRDFADVKKWSVKFFGVRDEFGAGTFLKYGLKNNRYGTMQPTLCYKLDQHNTIPE